MEEHHKVLFPAFLIIFASFLAFNADVLVETYSSGVERISGQKITGMVVSNDCGSEDEIVVWVDEHTGHVSMVGAGLDADKCAKLEDAAVVDPNRFCEADGSNIVMYVANGVDGGASFSEFYGLDVYDLNGGFTIAYVADTENNCVRRITPDGVVDTVGPVCGGTDFNNLLDVIVNDNGTALYVLDSGNYCIKELNIDSGVVTNFAGSCGTQGHGANQFSNPISFDRDDEGNFYVVDDHCIKNVTADGSLIEKVAGSCGNAGYATGSLSAARFSSPSGIAVGDGGVLFVADKDNHVIRGVDLINDQVDTLAGSPQGAGYATGSNAQFNEPYGVVLVGSVLYIGDMNNYLIRGMDINTFYVTDFAGNRTAGWADGTGTSGVMFNAPAGLSSDKYGNIYVADSLNFRVRVMTTDEVVSTLAGNGEEGDANTLPIGNAHVYAPDATAGDLPDSYMRVCYDAAQCGVAASGQCESTFGNEWECLMSFEGDGGSKYNAHSGICGKLANDLCCTGAEGFCGDGILGNSPNEDCEVDSDCPGYPGEICDVLGGCQCVPSGDGDGDGIDDVNDNCINFPNGPDLGTCITNDTHSNPVANLTVSEATTCMSHADCAGESYSVGSNVIMVEYCEMTQANGDGDNCGNACDLDSTDDMMCLLPGDQNITIPGDCTNALASADFGWSESEVERGEVVDIELDLNGDNSCTGIAFIIGIYNADDPLETSIVDPAPLVVSGDFGSTNWTAENNNPGPNPNDALWMVKATAGGDVLTSPDVLTVNASADSYCGDGVEDDGEQCDDGNNDDGDGCSFNCLIESPYGSGYGDDCSSFCVRGTVMCDGNDVMICGDYTGEGCNEFRYSHSCTGGMTCNSNFGGCISPGCSIGKGSSCNGVDDWVCGAWSDCVDERITRSCVNCDNGCSVSPVDEMNCSIEPPVKGSFFGLVSLLIAIGLILLYYGVRKN